MAYPINSDNIALGIFPMEEDVVTSCGVRDEPVLSICTNDNLDILWGAVIVQGSGMQMAEFGVGPNTVNLLFVNRGKLSVLVDGKPFVAHPGQAIVILPFEVCVGAEPHEKELHCQWLSFEIRRRGRRDNNNAINISRVSNVSDRDMVSELLRLLTEEYHKNRRLVPQVPAEAQGAKFLLLSLLSRLHLTESDRISETNALTVLAGRARGYMRINFGQPYTIAEVAEHLECSREYLRMAFHHAYGKSPKQFLLELRMRRAVYHLLRSRMSIEQIARECGYESPGYFTRVFTREHGVSPTHYRIAHGDQYLTGGI